MARFITKGDKKIPINESSSQKSSKSISESNGMKIGSGTKVPKGIEPLEPFKLREREQLLDEENVSRDFKFEELDSIVTEIDSDLSKRFFELNPDRDFFSPEVAFDFEKEQGNKLDPEFDTLLTERRKVVGAINNKVVRSLG